MSIIMKSRFWKDHWSRRNKKKELIQLEEVQDALTTGKSDELDYKLKQLAVMNKNIMYQQ